MKILRFYKNLRVTKKNPYIRCGKKHLNTKAGSANNTMNPNLIRRMGTIVVNKGCHTIACIHALGTPREASTHAFGTAA